MLWGVRILLTNDDGIDGPGLHALARALKTCGHDIVIAAPNRDYSGYGAALGPLHTTERTCARALHPQWLTPDGARPR